MERFERYYTDIRDINGIKTCIVSQEYLDDVLSDLEVLSALLRSMPIEEVRRIMQYLIREAKSNPTRIFLAFAEKRISKKIHFWWEPINCYKDGDFYYHVSIRDNWVCIECRHNNLDKFIMPKIEHDPIFYAGTDNEYPSIPPLFKRKKCINCGKTLQNHFICTEE